MEQLGVADLAQGLAEARQLWQDWAEQEPPLASAPAVDGLRDWLMLVGRARRASRQATVRPLKRSMAAYVC